MEGKRRGKRGGKRKKREGRKGERREGKERELNPHNVKNRLMPQYSQSVESVGYTSLEYDKRQVGEKQLPTSCVYDNVRTQILSLSGSFLVWTYSIVTDHDFTLYTHCTYSQQFSVI